MITLENINEILDANYTYLSKNKIYERERIAWPDTELLNENTRSYTTDWLIDRIRFLDQAFENFDVITNIEEIHAQIEWDISPNPSSGLVTITSAKNITQIQVFTKVGLLVKEAYGDNISQIDLQSMLQDIYFIKVVNEAGEIGIKKILLQ